MRLTPRVAGFRSEYPAGFKLECMAGFVGTRTDRARKVRFGPKTPKISSLPRLPKFPAADRHWPSKPCRGERNFWMQRREAKNRPERPQGSPETERVERYRAKIPTETAYREPEPGVAE